MSAEEEPQGGRIFFSSAGRSLEEEDEVRLTTVGVDIGSSTSHLVFSHLVLERTDTRYVVAERTVLHESEILLTPYAPDGTIDAAALGRFVDAQYARAGLTPDAIDTGALILTGVAVRRRNARAIGDLFAAQAGRLVAVSAGDALEATLAAFGSGAAARSRQESARVMNVDIGGGTTKIAVCERGAVVDQTALDAGARLVVLDGAGRVARIEEAGRRHARDAGVPLEEATRPTEEALQAIATGMAERVFAAMQGGAPDAATASLLRLDPLRAGPSPDVITFSGGVGEYVYGRQTAAFGDLGPRLARAVRARVDAWGPRVAPSLQAIRATVVGASQYTIQVSGGTIFVSPAGTLPLRNVPVVAPDLPFADDPLSADRVADSVSRALRRLELDSADQPVAVFYRFAGPATHARLDAFVRGVARALSAHLDRGYPLVLVGDRDVGGLVGIHCAEEARIGAPVVSIDGIALQDLDHVDIGALMPASGAVPVVVKSLVFPASAELGRAGAAARPRGR
ncbi:MAG TPA: ethanolamine ammonia-lyase reactivating factor EutA [Vicinamibacteria bacterium]|nr:ethanolamine ammonia-lyase reactivating factor EutA [Vicinamibacteria bacterium]